MKILPMRTGIFALALLLVACDGGGVEAINPANGEVRTFDSADDVPIGWVVCGDTCVGVDAGEPVMPTIELGTGELEFEPMVDGQDLEFILGPQGGYHFLASMRVTGVDPGTRTDLTDPRNPTTEFQAWVGDTRVDLRASSYTQGLDRRADGEGYEMIGRLLILDITGNSDLANMNTRIVVTVRDADGIMLEDERMIRAIPSPLN